MNDKILRYAQRARLPDYPCHARYVDRHHEVHDQRTNSREDVGRMLALAIAEQRKKGGKLYSEGKGKVRWVFYNGVSILSLVKIKRRASPRWPRNAPGKRTIRPGTFTAPAIGRAR